MVVVRRAEVRARDEQGADHQHAGLEGDHAGDGVARVRAAGGGQSDDEQHQAVAVMRDAGPLARTDLEAEDPLGQHGEHDDAGREHGLDDRQRGEHQRGDVEQPRGEGDAHADREPLELNSAARAATDVDRRRGVGAAVLVQEAELRRDGADRARAGCRESRE